MSKHFGGGGGGGGRRMEKEYPPPPPRRVIEDKRPSVFDRLGVRKYEESLLPPHSHYHGSGGGGDGGPYRRSDGPGGPRKHSPMQNPMMGGGGRRSGGGGDRIRSRSRSRSFSPRSRKMLADVHHHGGHMGGPSPGPMKRPSKMMKEISPHDHRMRPRSNSPGPMRRKSDKLLHGGGGNSPKWREEGGPPVPRHHKGAGKPKKSGKKSGKKSKDKKAAAVKGRSSSSGSSGETSSSSRSASSSSTTSEASSSSTGSSSSDSSVPSIKLRHDKQKRKKPKRPSSKSESVSTGQVQSRIMSSGSSIDSGNLRDNRDLREKIKAKTRQNYERMQDGTPPDLRQQRRPPPPDQYGGGRNFNKPDIREESPAVGGRRRRPSGSSSFEDKPGKRRRILSPEEFAPSPRRAPPNDPPAGVHPMRRGERSPLPRDRIRVIQSPMRRAPAEDNRRVDVRPDITKRLESFADGSKPRDMDRFRDEGSYGRDGGNRQKERMAPARPNQMRQAPHPHPGQQIQDRDRGMMDRPGGNSGRYEPRHTHNRPLLLLPPGAAADQQKLPPSGYKNSQEDRVLRTSIQSPSPSTPKHAPMIVKSKEALIERYREMKPSQYVDMWVDKTVEACAPPGSTIVSPPPKDVPATSTRTLNDSTATDGSTKPTSIKDIEDMLSDFSDDADELLNDDGGEQKSEKSVKDTSSSVADKDKLKVEEAEVASIATTETNTPVVEKKPSNIATPVSVLSSQDRKSVGTPQRSFLEVSREGQSLPSRSQTEDDILERMDFEEISDEELGDVGGENKIPIVDALGVDWASLVCGEKNRPVSPSSVLSVASTSLMKVRKRWTPLQVISRVGVIKNCSERLLQKIVDMKMKEEPYSDSVASGEDQMELEEKIQDEMQNAGKFRKMRARSNVIDTIGLGPNSRALSSRRDMALRRYYLGMPQKSLVSMDMLHQNPASSTVQDLESIGELYRLSLSLFKGSESAAAVV